MDDEQRAAAFYASSQATQPGGQATGQKPAEQSPQPNLADRLRVGAPESQQSDAPEPSAMELVRNDRERKFFDVEKTHGPFFDELTATEGLNAGPRDLAPVDGVDRREFSEIVQDLGGSQAKAQEFLDDYRTFSQGWPQLTDGEKQAHLDDAIQGMKEKYGAEWEHAWDAANALAKRDPRIAKMLVESGLGADRKTVLSFAEEALRQRVAGRLR